jgi:hypothetical protein
MVVDLSRPLLTRFPSLGHRVWRPQVAVRGRLDWELDWWCRTYSLGWLIISPSPGRGWLPPLRWVDGITSRPSIICAIPLSAIPHVSSAPLGFLCGPRYRVRVVRPISAVSVRVSALGRKRRWHRRRCDRSSGPRGRTAGSPFAPRPSVRTDEPGQVAIIAPVRAGAICLWWSHHIILLSLSAGK